MKHIVKAAIQYASAPRFSCLQPEVREELALAQVAKWIEMQMPGSEAGIGSVSREIIRDIRRHFRALEGNS